MKSKELQDLPWAGQAWRELFQLAAFAKDQACADGVIAVFLRGPYAKLGWFLPPELYPKMPLILRSAADDSFHELEWVITDPGVQLPDTVRKEIQVLLQHRRGITN
jgi:hypothetical protein